jgi:CRP-like cAMP-binding protein
MASETPGREGKMTVLDNYLSAEIRQVIEDQYYARINAQSRFEFLQKDPDFLDGKDQHIALFSDHGVVHVRNVAQLLLETLDQVHGVLIPKRPTSRLMRMKGYGVLVAYLHDIGMVDFSPSGRAMHPEFAAQAVFDPAADSLVQTIWAQNSGNVAWYLVELAKQGVLTQPPRTVLRELLAMSACHSKSKVPIAVLNDPERLRAVMITMLTTKLEHLYHLQRVEKIQARLAALPATDSRVAEAKKAVSQALADLEEVQQRVLDPHNPHLVAYYQDPHQEAYRWLISPDPRLQEWVADVIDTLRILRCADALRQRGAALKTSGGYEIFVDQHTGSAVYALRQRDEQLFLYASPDMVGAGEANIAGSELDPAGDLRLSFVRGAFSTAAATQHAAHCTAMVVNDIQRDIIGSFQRAETATPTPDLKPAAAMRILLEETDDNLDFAHQVRQQLADTYPELTAAVQVVPSLRLASPFERRLYRAAAPITWSADKRRDILARIGQSGHRVEDIDPQRAFENVRLATVPAGQVLIEAHMPAAFVYIPLAPGLQVVPLGGYQNLWLQPWMPLGLTGVIRGATRNATVIATRQLALLMIPRTVYLQHWHRTHSLASFRRLLQESQRQTGQDSEQLTQIEKAQLLQEVPLFAVLDNELLYSLAEVATEVDVAADEQLFAAGSMGRSLYVVAAGRVKVHQGSLVLAELGEGEVFGEMTLLTPEPRMAAVTALVPTHLLRIDRDTFNQLVDTHSGIARGVITALSQRLRDITSAYTQHTADESD